MRVDNSARSGGIIRISLIFFNMKVYCVFTLESPHRGDSNEYTQCTFFNMKTKNTLNYHKSAAIGFFQGTQERVRKSRGKRAISIRAIEVLLYIAFDSWNFVPQLLSQYLNGLYLSEVSPCLHYFLFQGSKHNRQQKVLIPNQYLL